jgi:hypothetical protein
MVFGEANIFARMEFCATLTYENVTCNNRLAAEFLNAEAPTFGVATVTGATTSFFMSHETLLKPASV